MQIHLDTGDNRYRVKSYEARRVTIGDDTFEHSLILMPNNIVTDWRPQHVDDLDLDTVQDIARFNPEVVLLGSGSRLRFPKTEWLAAFLNAHIGIECMDTGAACRTYNLLMGEGRKVVAALLLADPPLAPSDPRE